MKYVNKAHKAKADKLRRKAKEDKARGPEKAGGPSLRNAAKQIRERKKKVENQVNSSFNR